jgi:NADPH2:quinone reductase
VRAIEVSRFGGPEVLTLNELPDPVPEPGQVLVASSASDVLFVDTMIRSGRGVDYFPIRPPYLPGNGVGGTVVGLGEGVDAGWLGREIVAHTGGPGGGGGYAELAAVDIEACALVPRGVDLLDATAVLHDGTTALRILETTAIDAGEWVLVLGAAGGMGFLLVQLLIGRGVHVIGAAGGRTKRDVASLAGAQAAVDYGQADWTDAVLDATDGRSLSVILDGVGGRMGEEAFDLLAEGGRFSAHGAPSGSFAAINREIARNSGIAVTTIADLQYGPGDRARLLAASLSELKAGRIEPLIGQTFSLADASKAHMAIEARETVAKSLLLSDGE